MTTVLCFNVQYTDPMVSSTRNDTNEDSCYSTVDPIYLLYSTSIYTEVRVHPTVHQVRSIVSHSDTVPGTVLYSTV